MQVIKDFGCLARCKINEKKTKIIMRHLTSEEDIFVEKQTGSETAKYSVKHLEFYLKRTH